jgi:hypothetical protein
MSRGLGVIERAIAQLIAKGRKPLRVPDVGLPPEVLAEMEKPSPVHVTPRAIMFEVSPHDWDKGRFVPQGKVVHRKAIIRAMHSFVRKFPQYALASGGGNSILYERGDRLGEMWARINSQSHSRKACLEDARRAMNHLDQRRNEPFFMQTEKPRVFHINRNGKTTARRRKFFPDIYD